MILITGGAGFIGANFILDFVAATGEAVVNLDKLTYAGNPRNLDVVLSSVLRDLVLIVCCGATRNTRKQQVPGTRTRLSGHLLFTCVPPVLDNPSSASLTFKEI